MTQDQHDNNFPTLHSMGIQNPNEIDRFHVHRSSNVDTLRVVYKRKKGSLLPSSRRYRFPLCEKGTQLDPNTQQSSIVYEVSPALRSALEELEQVVNGGWEASRYHEVLSEEIERLEADFAARISYIKALMENPPR